LHNHARKAAARNTILPNRLYRKAVEANRLVREGFWGHIVAELAALLPLAFRCGLGQEYRLAVAHQQ